MKQLEREHARLKNLEPDHVHVNLVADKALTNKILITPVENEESASSIRSDQVEIQTSVL